MKLSEKETSILRNLLKDRESQIASLHEQLHRSEERASMAEKELLLVESHACRQREHLQNTTHKVMESEIGRVSAQHSAQMNKISEEVYEFLSHVVFISVICLFVCLFACFCPLSFVQPKNMYWFFSEPDCSSHCGEFQPPTTCSRFRFCILSFCSRFSFNWIYVFSFVCLFVFLGFFFKYTSPCAFVGSGSGLLTMSDMYQQRIWYEYDLALRSLREIHCRDLSSETQRSVAGLSPRFYLFLMFLTTPSCEVLVVSITNDYVFVWEPTVLLWG